ncbi:hypothetical protein [Kitasatospora sp. NPDC004289]
MSLPSLSRRSLTRRSLGRTFLRLTAALSLGGALLAAPAQASAEEQRFAPTYTPMLARLNPGATEVQRWNGGSSWSQIGGPAGEIYTGGGVLLATNPSSGDVYKYDGANWARIGGPGRKFAVGGSGQIYGLSPDSSGVYQWLSGTNWKQIGGPALDIVAGGSRMIAIEPGSGNVYLYGGQPNNWAQIGGPGAQFAIDPSSRIYGLSPDFSGVYEWTGGKSWHQIGSEAGQIVAGSAGLLATNPTTGNAWLRSGGHWNEIGGPARQFALDAAGSIFELDNGSQAVRHWTGGTNWDQIGGPADVIVAS